MDQNTELLQKILNKLDDIDSAVVDIKDQFESVSGRSRQSLD